MLQSTKLFLAVLFLVVYTSGAFAQVNRNRPLEIVLRLSALSDSESLTIGDVVELRGGNEALRQRIAGLDLAVDESGASLDSPRIKKTEVFSRILMDGIDASEFVLFVVQ